VNIENIFLKRSKLIKGKNFAEPFVVWQSFFLQYFSMC